MTSRLPKPKVASSSLVVRFIIGITLFMRRAADS
jgi:hypothetical protein